MKQNKKSSQGSSGSSREKAIADKPLLEDLVCKIYDDLAARMVVALYRERDRVKKSYGKLFPAPKPKRNLTKKRR